MKVSLIITTYNWPEALKVVIESALRQSRPPDEIIIADDGSGLETAGLIARIASEAAMPIIHSWQEDRGFRASESRNRAISKASGDYVIIIDGDIYLPFNFISDHVESARPGWFIQGGRVLTSERLGRYVLSESKVPSIWSSGIKNRHNLIRSKFLSKNTSYHSNSDKGSRSCNMSFWMDDVIKVNGFNEAFVGWGREDSEFTLRLINSGVKRLYLKFLGVGIHIYHLENSKDCLAENDKLLRKTKDENLTCCAKGLDKYIRA